MQPDPTKTVEAESQVTISHDIADVSSEKPVSLVEAKVEEEVVFSLGGYHTITRTVTFREEEFDYPGTVESILYPTEMRDSTVQYWMKSVPKRGFYGRPEWIATDHPSHIVADPSDWRGWRSAAVTKVSIYQTPVFTATPVFNPDGVWIVSPYIKDGTFFLPKGNKIQIIGPEGQETFVSFEERDLPLFYNRASDEVLYSLSFRADFAGDVYGGIVHQSEPLPYVEIREHIQMGRWHHPTPVQLE